MSDHFETPCITTSVNGTWLMLISQWLYQKLKESLFFLILIFL